ncbi:MAG: hypothetical protein A2W31_16910 [Planctomycetes bacterium RBG_16_64_10]|nr:MAG: hypothetical protein A2W31_16910 [Planctomycetes bacterium RBG_16_64_10]
MIAALNLLLTLSAWDYYLVEPNVKLAEVWSLQDGVLVCKGEPMGYLHTKDDYTNFKLVVEWRWPPGSKPGNSGVLMRITGEPRALPKCVEAQLMHGSAGDFWAFHGFRIDGDPARTSKSDHDQHGQMIGIKKIKDAEKPPGQWNRYEITASDGTITLVVNGEQVNQATGCDVVAGKIGLQSEGGEIHFRRVEIVPLDRPKTP